MRCKRAGLHRSRLTRARAERRPQGFQAYDGGVGGGDDQLRAILRRVVPIEQYASRIAEAHGLGHGPGENIELWNVGIQRSALEIWKETLPAWFLSRVAESYELCQELMAAVLPDESAFDEWGNIERYLGVVAAAISEDPTCAASRDATDALGVGDMPEVIHYEKLAGLMHPDAVEALRAAAAAVGHFCRFGLGSAPSEVQLACLQGLANGERHAALAKRLGYSERHLQRILADIWHQFDVDGTIQGMAFAVQNGWVSVPDGTL